MKRLVRSMKRSLSFLLAAAMIFTMMPQTGMTAEASEYQAESVLGGGKTVQETDLAADVDSVREETGGGDKAAAYSETDPESGSQAGEGTNPGGETGSGTGDETGGETNPGTGDETDGETNSGVGDEVGGETNPGEEDGTGGETNPGTGSETGDGTGSGTNPGTGDESDGETNPGTGDEQGGETDPGEGEETGGETNPDEEEETDGETDPGEEEETDEETDPDEEEENDKPDGKLSALGNARSGASDFTIDANGTLTAYTGAGGDITIPDTVTAIGNNVFKGKTNITGVTIPGTVLSIGEGAFSGCTGLIEVDLKEGLETIGNAAFDGVPFGRKELTDIVNGTLTIPGSVTKIGGAAFRNSAYLETVTFEDGSAELVMSSSYGVSSDAGAFRNCQALKQVTLPDQLKALPKNTFEGCTGLEQVQFGEGLQSIGNWAFKDCSSLQGAAMPSSLRTIEEGAFSGCSGMIEVTLNEGLETIGNGAFDGVAFGKKELTYIKNGTLTIPGSVTKIGGAAFRNSAYLETVTFEDGPAELVMSSSYGVSSDAGAFRNCQALKQVTLPDQLKALPKNTFEGCTGLEQVQFGEGLQSIGNWAFKDCSSLQGAAMPSSLRTIEEGAFSGCSGMIEVTLNEGLETIGNGAFDGVAFGKKELTGIANGTLTIPGSVTKIGGAAFRNSAYLETVTFEDGPAELVMSSSYGVSSDAGAFRNCQALKQVTLPDQLNTLPKNTFEGCSSLESVQFGEYLATIGSWAFKDCSSLQGAAMPSSLRTIEEGAFSGCSGMIEVTLNEGLETIGNGAFDGVAFGKKELTGIANGTLTIPGSVTKIGGAAFRNSAYLETVTFEDGPAELVMSSSYGVSSDAGAFRNCQALKQVTLPDQLNTLPKNTFEGCSSLESVQFGEYLATIGSWAFKDCSSLQGAAMPSSLRTIEEGAFSGCSGMIEVTLNEGLQTIGNGAFDGVAFGKKELTGIANGTLTIPGSVTKIGGAAFRNSAYLETVTFEDGPAELVMSSSYGVSSDAGAFRNCQALKQVTLPDQLNTLPKNTFEGCSSLESVQFGEYLATIGSWAFKDCSSLQGAAMPSSLRTIEEGAFSGCSGMIEVTLNEGLETIGNGAFDGVAFGKKELTGIANGTLTIPGSVTKIGGAAFRNSAYLETVTFEDGPAELVMSSSYGVSSDAGAFRNCQALKQVTLPDQLKTLPKNIFEGCSSLESVQFGEYLTTIRSYAFSGCSSLQWIYLPEPLTTIEAEAFSKCGVLEALYIPKTVTVIGNNILKNCPKVVIYGVRGSEAENYANKNNIPFREEGELESIRFVTGISLNRSKITVAGEDALESVFVLTATVKPSTAQDKRVDFTSNNEAVAHVDAQGKVTIKGYGTTTITATARDNEYGTKTATCMVTVLRRLSEAEKESILWQLQEANADKLTVVTNICETVKDISLDCPADLESVEWRLPYSISTGVETYDVIVEKDGYEKAVVSGIEITGITVEGISVSGANKLQNGKSTDLSVEVQTTGGELSTDDYEIKWETPANSGVSLTNPEQNPVTVRGNANKTATVTGYLLLKKDGKPADRKNNALKNKQWFSASTKITVTGDAVADRIEIEAADRNGQKVELASMRELSNITEPVEYQLSAKVYSGEDPLSNPVLQWKSTNPSVAEVKAQGDRVTLRVKEKGAAVISVSASKNGGFTESFRVVVKDSTPRLEETGISLNLNQIQPSAVVHISPSDGYAIAEESLVVVKENGSVADFTISRVSNKETEYQIGIKDGKTLSGKHKVFLQMKTSAGEQQAHRLPLTITISKQLPKVTVTQESVFNLYEKGAEAKITVKTDTAIAEIEYIPSAASEPKLVLKESNPTDGYFTVTAKGQTSGNYKKTSAKGKLRITFAGYRADATYDKTFTIKVNKNLPAVLAVPVNTVLYPETPEYQETELNKTAISFLLKADQQDITAEAGWNMELSGNPPTGVTVEQNSEGQPITVTFENAAKTSVALKFKVTNDNWIDQTGVKASCTIKKGTTPEIDFSNNKPILNTEYDLDKYEPVEIALCVKNHPERRIVRLLSVEGKDAKAKAVKEEGFAFELKESILQVGIRDKSLFTVKNAKYTYLVKGMDERGIPVSGSLTVTVTKTPAKATVKQSGSIDLLNREGTQILCKPTIKNYTDTIESVYLYGSYASSFSAKCEDGNIVIKAREGKQLKVKTTYKLFLRIRLESGVVLDSEVRVTPKQNNPKLSLNQQKTVLFEASPGEPFGKSIAVAPTKEGGPEISSIELTNGGDTFGYTDEGDGYGTLYVLDTASQKVNKTYKLKLAVRFKDGAANAAPVYVTVSVNYKK